MPLASEQSKRKRNLLIISAFLVLLLGASALRITLRPAELPIASNLVLIALANLNVVVLSLLLVLLFRNLIKLWFERRQQVIGARFKTKLVLAFLILSVGPAALIFAIASNFINRSIEGWFKPQVERPLDHALAVAQAYYQNVQAVSLRHARHLATILTREELLAEGRRDVLDAWLAEQQDALALGAVTVFDAQGRVLVHAADPALQKLSTREVDEIQLRGSLHGEEVTTHRELSEGDLVQAIVPVWADTASRREVVGAVVVGSHVPERLEARIRLISDAFKEYKQLKLLRNPIKFIYILLFLLMTLIVVFSFTWFGLYLARGITNPVRQLAEGTREVAAGNLTYKVQGPADDEIGELVESFNRMTDDLGESKRRLEEAYLDLQDKHTELEERRRYIETVLEAITTGVVSFDPLGRITTINRAAARMFGLDEGTTVGRLVDEVFARPDARDVAALVHRTRRLRGGPAEQALQLRRDGTMLSLVASATALRGPDQEYAGAVVVFDDLTELLQAQRLSAWREVAQRIAHEIKNPLTPIQLSAQRLRRRLARAPGEEAELVAECTETIVQEVDALKRLVDEFSRFARMPAPVTRPTDVRPIIEAVATLYRESHSGLNLVTRHAAEVPVLDIDPDHLRRAVLNLVDNAVEAVNGTGDVLVETAWDPAARCVRISVTDSGPGIPTEHREKLFQPYFSTKVTGMGLGLPIAREIVQEHRGTIRVEGHTPHGTRFVIELPVTGALAPVEALSS